jgi:hypothetical protein
MLRERCLSLLTLAPLAGSLSVFLSLHSVDFRALALRGLNHLLVPDLQVF